MQDKDLLKSLLKETLKSYLSNLSPSDMVKLRDTVETGIKITILLKMIKEGQVSLNEIVDSLLERYMKKIEEKRNKT
ncbi:MAG: hypothetical protein LWW95_08300 [Candidatus Desulfofervidus auxilii]|nr:hypothetical protein [Candidatus Desulfofervidus auxilii]